MGEIVPVPRCTLEPWALVLRPDGTIGPDHGGAPDAIVPRWFPGEGEALSALFGAFPDTQILEVRGDEGTAPR